MTETETETLAVICPRGHGNRVRWRAGVPSGLDAVKLANKLDVRVGYDMQEMEQRDVCVTLIKARNAESTFEVAW